MKKFYYSCSRFLLVLAITVLTPGAFAQTVLISPTGDGGFENGTTFAANGWTVSNTPILSYNAWWVGNTAVTAFGTNNCAYISDDAAGATHNYNITQSCQLHFYRDVTIAAGEQAVLQFDLIVNGQANLDLLQVSVAPTTTTPLGSDVHPGSGFGAMVPGATVVGNYQLLGTGVQTVTAVIPADAIGNCSSAATFRLIFSWKSNATTGTQPPAAVDNIQLVSSPFSPSPTVGTFTIDNTLPTGGSNFISFTDAINWLNATGSCLTNPLVFNVSSGQVFSEWPPEITASGTVANTITFQKSGTGANPIVRGINGIGTLDAVIVISGANYITFDGIDVEDDLVSNTTTTTQMEYGYAIRNASATQGSNFNTIKNCRVALNITRTTAVGIVVTSSTTGGGFTPSDPSGTNSDCLIDNVFVEDCGLGGILITSGSSTYPGFNNKVINSTIGASYTGIPSGSIGTGATSAYGIQFNNQGDFEISNNLVRNIVSTGIKRGVYVLSAQGNSVLEKNIVQGIRNSSPTGTSVQYGIDVALSTLTSIPPNSLRIYNNFISDITSAHSGTATATRVLVGMSLGTGSANSTYEADFNSISIDGSGSLTVSSVCFEFGSTVTTNNVRNNIFANYTAAQSGTSKHYCIRSTTVSSLGSAASIVNYNDYYLADLTNGFTGITSTTDRPTITDWSTAITTPSGIDANSFAADPQFFNIHTDLHTTSPNISGTGNIAGITWVTDDIDGDPRTNPIDIGADQFTPAASIDMGAVALISPATAGCFTSAEDVEVSIRNYSTLPIDFTTDNVTVTVDVTGAVTQQFVVVLNNNSLNGGVPLAGGDDLVVPVGTLNMSTPGVYTFDASTTVAGDGGPLNDTMVAVTIDASGGTISVPYPSICLGDSITLTSTGALGPIQWESSTDGGVTWTPISGATSAILVDSPVDTTTYRVEVCGTLYTNTVVVDVIDPQPPVTVNDTVCGQGTANLSASGNGTLNWYDAPVGGTLLNTGTTYAPFVTATTTFYVENSSGAGTQNVGPTDPTSVGAFASWNSTAQWLNFTVSQATTIQSVDMFFSSAVGSAFSVVIRDASSLSIVHTYNGTVSVSNPTPTTAQVVPINASLNPGTYQMNFGTPTNTFRNSAGAVYPYQMPGVLSITGNTFDPSYYYMFYNWKVVSGCSSSREPVTVVVTPADSVFASAVNMTICEGDSTVLSVSSANPDYTYTWSPAGSLVSSSGASVVAVPSFTTDYIVEAIDNTTNCVTADTITIGVNMAPSFFMSATPDTICVGSSSQISASGAGSQVAGLPTFTSTTGYSFTGEGLTFNANVPLMINSVDMYTTNNGSVTVELFDSGNNSLASATASLLGGNVLNVVQLNFVVPAGIGYKLVLTANSTGSIKRENPFTGWATLPNAGGTLEITGGAAINAYYYFYNWQVSSGGGTSFTYDWTPTASLSDPTIFDPIATPSVTTDYIVTVTDNIGCFRIDTVTLEVIQNPIAGIDGFTQVCTDETALDLFTVITTQDITGTWSYPSNPNALDDNLLNPSLIPTGTTTVQYVVANQCNADTAVATVDIVPLPSSGSEVTGFTHCNAQALYLFDVLTNLVTFGGTWTTTNANGQLVGNTFYPGGGQFGPVQFTYTVDNSICDPVSTTVTVNLVDCTGIDENDAANISLYPNPNNGQFFVMNGGNNMTVTVEVMDMQGKVVFSKQINLTNGSREEINVDTQSGMYLVRVTNETSSIVRQIIIK